jgi:hypothetical protein
MPIGWWLTPFVDACHGICLSVGRQVYSDFSKFLPEITFPPAKDARVEMDLPMKRNFVLFNLQRQIQRQVCNVGF